MVRMATLPSGFVYVIWAWMTSASSLLVVAMSCLTPEGPLAVNSNVNDVSSVIDLTDCVRTDDLLAAPLPSRKTSPCGRNTLTVAYKTIML